MLQIIVCQGLNQGFKALCVGPFRISIKKPKVTGLLLGGSHPVFMIDLTFLHFGLHICAQKRLDSAKDSLTLEWQSTLLLTQQRGHGQGQGRLSAAWTVSGEWRMIWSPAQDKILIRLYFHKSRRSSEQASPRCTTLECNFVLKAMEMPPAPENVYLSFKEFQLRDSPIIRIITRDNVLELYRGQGQQVIADHLLLFLLPKTPKCPTSSLAQNATIAFSLSLNLLWTWGL